MKKEFQPLIDMLNSDNVEDNNLGLEIVDTHYNDDKRTISYLRRNSDLDYKWITNNDGVIIGKKKYT